MLVGEYCTKEVVTTQATAGVRDTARLMREQHVGTVVVAEGADDERVPLGIVTDRDLVIEVMAADADPGSVTAGDLCTGELVSARMDDDLMSTLDRMRAAGVRRIPVVDDRGMLQGLLAVDDLLCVVGEITSNLTQLVAREVNVEVHKRP